MCKFAYRTESNRKLVCSIWRVSTSEISSLFDEIIVIREHGSVSLCLARTTLSHPCLGQHQTCPIFENFLPARLVLSGCVVPVTGWTSGVYSGCSYVQKPSQRRTRDQWTILLQTKDLISQYLGKLTWSKIERLPRKLLKYYCNNTW